MAKKRVGIIGSGPGGIFAADELTKEDNMLEVILFERDKYSSGGMINDCKLNLTTEIGMDINSLGISKDLAMNLIEQVDRKFIQHGAPIEVSGEGDEKIERMMVKAQRCGLKLIPARQRHVGTDNSRALVDSYKNELIGRGVVFRNNYTVNKILTSETGRFIMVVNNNNNPNGTEVTESLEVDYIVAAPGRAGSDWFRKQADNLGIKYDLGPIDVGVRLEMPRYFYDELTDIIYDPKLIMDFEDHELTRTFCTNPGGRVRIEHHKEKGYLLVNGDATQDKKTQNTNLAILTRIYLTEPLVDTKEEGIEMARRVTRYGGGKPIIQRVGDFMNKKRSRAKDFEEKESRRGVVYVKPTLSLNKVSPGDLRLAFAGKIIDKLSEMLERLDQLVSGGAISNPGNNLYAPEIKFYNTNIKTDNTMETNINGFYVAGDGVGKSRGIVGAGITGILAARGILSKL